MLYVKSKEAWLFVSKISSKGQITVPKPVRDAIGVQYGDMVAYAIRGETATLRRVEPFDAAYHAAISATVTEWATPEDEEAFGDL